MSTRDKDSVFCDECGDIIMGDVVAYERLPFPVESADVGESAQLCVPCAMRASRHIDGKRLCPNADKFSSYDCPICKSWYYCEVDGCENFMEVPSYIPDHTTVDADGIADDIYACEDCYRKHQFEVWWNGPQKQPCIGCGAEWHDHIMDHGEGCALMAWVNECDEESRRDITAWVEERHGYDG